MKSNSDARIRRRVEVDGTETLTAAPGKEALILRVLDKRPDLRMAVLRAIEDELREPGR